MYNIIVFLLGIGIGYYSHFFYKIYLEKIQKKESSISPEQLQEEIHSKQKTLELLNNAIIQKKDEKYNLVKQNINLRHRNQDLIILKKNTEELQKKAMEDDMKIYIPEKEKKKFDE